MNRDRRLSALCLRCGVHYKYRVAAEAGKFCSNSCQRKHAAEEQYKAWVVGDGAAFKSPKAIRRAVIRRDGYRCAECLLAEWRGEPLTLEVEHKNGNSGDNSPSNVCLNCPNCHSQSATFRSKNRGNGRYFRRERYRLGKSS